MCSTTIAKTPADVSVVTATKSSIGRRRRHHLPMKFKDALSVFLKVKPPKKDKRKQKKKSR